ncbi:hypothetical protein F4819DRAFT_162037 [Hypoxylon fuscum]|nr:hypothetical protein F4819DRAFT_162037 [Hypoxylon fuscum]
MAQPRCLSYTSPARALHRVLVSDLTPSSAQQQHATTTYYLFPPRLFSSSRALPSIISTSPRTPRLLEPKTVVATHHGAVRTLTTTPALRRIHAFKGKVTNAKIPYQWVRIASPPPDNTLSPPQRTSAVLASLNPKTHTLVMVAAPPPPATDEDGDGPPVATAQAPAAIARIIDNAAAAAASAEAERGARRKAVDTKELELSWSIAPHDLGHKLRRLRAFLEKGLSVEVMLAKKRGGRTAARDEAEAVLLKVREAVAAVDGAKESRKLDGQVGGVARLYFEGVPEGKRRKKVQQQAEENGEGEEA